jgi:hypothetical protein
MTTYDQQARQETAAREDYQIMMREMRQLEGRIEGLDMEMQTLNRNVDGVSRSATQGARAESDALRATIRSLEERVQALEQARARDRDAILDQVSKEMAALIATRPSSSGRGGRTSSSGGPPSGGEFYEHTVKAGENLSRIADAYEVRVKTIADDNQLSSPDQLRVGQILYIRK